MNKDKASFQSLFDDIMNEKKDREDETTKKESSPVLSLSDRSSMPVPKAAASDHKDPSFSSSVSRSVVSVSTHSASAQDSGKTEKLQDTDEDLEALFDRVAEERRVDLANPVSSECHSSPTHSSREEESGSSSMRSEVYTRVGEMARKINTLMRELGVDKFFESTASQVMPDTRERLVFVAEEVESASKTVLSVSEKSIDVLKKAKAEHVSLIAEWNKLFNGQLGAQDFKNLCIHTHASLQVHHQQCDELIASMNDLVMSQSFQDLTGQVLQKLIKVSKELEKQLLSFLLDNIPPEINKESPLSKKQFLDGPNCKRKEGGVCVEEKGPTLAKESKETDLEEILTSQEEVDALLDSLGF